MASINRFRGTPRATDDGTIRWIVTASNIVDPDIDVGPNATIPAPAGLVVGDLCVVYCYYRGATQSWSITTTGGQSWVPCATHRSATQMVQAFWCRFNGTWAANPVFTVGSGAETAIAVLHAFRGNRGADSRWALDQPPLLNSGAGTAFAVAGVTPQALRTISIACVASLDDNTYTLTAPGRWRRLGGAQYRSTGGRDGAVAFASLAQNAAQPTGAVTFTQATLGADAGITLVLTFKEGEDFDQGRQQISRAPSRKAPGRQMFRAQQLATDSPAAPAGPLTFGDTTPGTGEHELRADEAIVDRFTLSDPADLVALWVWYSASSAASDTKGLVLSDTSDLPDTVLQVTGVETVPGGGGWVSYPLTGSLAPGDYWLGVIGDATAASFIGYDTSGDVPDIQLGDGFAYATPPGTWPGTGRTIAGRLNVYVEYTLGSAAVEGTGAATLALTADATGVHGVAGTAAGTLALTSAAAGVHGVTGTAAATLALAAAATAVHGVTGTASATLALTSAATGAHGVTGTAAGTLALTASATGTHDIAGTGTATLALTAAASGVHGVAGAAAGTLALTASAAGDFTASEVTGTAAAVLALTGAASGVHGTAGAASGGLALTGAATGVHGVTGTAAATLALTAAAAGAHGVAGTAAATLALQAAADGIAGTPDPVDGTGAATLALTAAASGTHIAPEVPGESGAGFWIIPGPAPKPWRAPPLAVLPPAVEGTGAGTLRLVASATGTHGVAGSGAASIRLTADAVGEYVMAHGTGHAQLRLTASARGQHDRSAHVIRKLRRAGALGLLG